MDVWGVFSGDSTLSYGGSIRGGYYRDYEQFPYGTLEHVSNANSYPAKDSYSRVQEKCKQLKTEKQLRKDCPFCKEHKKRPLVNYMRKRDSRKHESICEDEEEMDEHEHEHELEHEHEVHQVSSLSAVPTQQSCKV